MRQGSPPRFALLVVAAACLLPTSRAAARFPINTWAAFETTVASETRWLAWGDVDGDGDLDLAAVNRPGATQLYLNDGNGLAPDAAWTSSESSDWNYACAWGDVDGDGDLDLAVGGDAVPLRIYHNDGGTLPLTSTWTNVRTDDTRSLSWVDIDGDGDLDLAVGNHGEPNHIFFNDGGVLEDMPSWSSAESEQTRRMVFGDVEGDGDVDMVTATERGFNRLHLNDGGLPTTATWSTTTNSNTHGVDLGDWDGDGDLDIAYANYLEPNQVYEWNGTDFGAASVWESTGANSSSECVAWGDWDGDGDLDLAVGQQVHRSPTGYIQNVGGTLSPAGTPGSSAESDDTISLLGVGATGTVTATSMPPSAGNEADPRTSGARERPEGTHLPRPPRGRSAEIRRDLDNVALGRRGTVTATSTSSAGNCRAIPTGCTRTSGGRSPPTATWSSIGVRRRRPGRGVGRLGRRR